MVLIEQRDDKPSMYREFLAAGHEGLQHWSSWPENCHELLDRAVRNGWTIGQRGETPRGPFVYFLNEGHPGTVIEMAELTPTRCVRRRSTGMAATPSAATGRAGNFCTAYVLDLDRNSGSIEIECGMSLPTNSGRRMCDR